MGLGMSLVLPGQATKEPVTVANLALLSQVISTSIKRGAPAGRSAEIDHT